MFDFLRKDDVLVVTRLDRLAHSIGDLQDIVRAIRAKGAILKTTEQRIDTSTAAGSASSTCWVFAEFETKLRRERQLEGIAKHQPGERLPGVGDPAVITRSARVIGLPSRNAQPAAVLVPRAQALI